MKIIYAVFIALNIIVSTAFADDYIVDKRGMHAFIQFKASHLGYSWLWGRFNDFDGHFSYDKNDFESSKIEVIIKTNSIDTNHAERDKHLRGEKFLSVDEFPEAKFVSTSFKKNQDGSRVMKGDFTLHGVTKPIAIDIKYIGEGKDPWGGYRVGFEGTTRITLADFNIITNLGPSSEKLDLIFSIEGVRQSQFKRSKAFLTK